jgi:16S rRNA A1518/A1519 N6-dimethyltransferase RsmA/KsgA/DIM1 with predicted DNA glycosylase/AP lyase activity
LGEDESAQQKVKSEEDFLEFVKLCFLKKRKTLVNNLRELAEPDEVRKTLGAVGLRPDARAEQISISNFGALYVALRK